MKLSDAVCQKIHKICDERNISLNKLASICCLTQSTLQHLTDGRSKNVKTLTVVRICSLPSSFSHGTPITGLSVRPTKAPVTWDEFELIPMNILEFSTEAT